MSEHLSKLKMNLELKGYSPKMVLTYVKWVKHFLNTFGIQPDELFSNPIKGRSGALTENLQRTRNISVLI